MSQEERNRKGFEKMLKDGKEFLERVTGKPPTEKQVRDFIQPSCERAENRRRENGATKDD